ncbi:phosphoribosylanthranilate isomerase [Bizionia argentinensis JUB59]|uniref:N-(5'-phosphoribosyl)anthranilate isomerase n=1 Tax=Bizionia argentinensis JUB59 TaxID=1046627 RepID=G2EE92_9FLAO|nr:phosphoribosylanthranilate isomerase [Bizionia argentinensis]EGV43238.1 phosphoribosylanthranilate isomerase [Bizionia argentinensis JUB59]
MKLKICGMKFPENIEALSKLQADYLGFIFYKKSARYFDGIIPTLANSIKKVGVFVDSSPTEIITILNNYNLDVIQLHGNESREFVSELKGMATLYAAKDFEVWKVFSVGQDFDFSEIKSFEKIVDKFLFDTKGKEPGGNGFTFNWNALKEYPSTKPFILSGGIGLDEVENLTEFSKLEIAQFCHAIDVNSKFEIEPGLKDIALLKEFKKKINTDLTSFNPKVSGL